MSLVSFRVKGGKPCYAGPTEAELPEGSEQKTFSFLNGSRDMRRRPWMVEVLNA